MKILVVDDEEYRHALFSKALSEHQVWHAYGYEHALELMKKVQFDIMYFDYDLGVFYNGSCLVNAVVLLPPELRPQVVVVHSWNPEGADMMMTGLKTSGIKAIRSVFGPNVILPAEAIETQT